MEPSYLSLYESGELRHRIEAFDDLLLNCRLCCHECDADRAAGERGFCAAPAEAVVSSYGPHHGEEGPLSGSRGSGTVFFAFCNSRCCFCQNYDISQLADGSTCTVEELAQTFMKLQEQGCHNLNLVTPAHFLPHSIAALSAAIALGFKLPIVYNSNGYDSLEVLRLLDGIVDIYLPDMKFGDDETAAKLTGMVDYPACNSAAVAEMYRQTGLLRTDPEGVAEQGVIVRHLVLPENLANSRAVFQSIARIDRNIPVNIMAQYYPAYKARNYEGLGRMITRREYEAAVAEAQQAGLETIWRQ